MVFLVRFTCTVLVLCLAATAAAQQTIYVNRTTGNNAWDGLCQEWDGGTCGPKSTIQAGIDAANPGDTVLAADGSYAGPGNRDLDFGGKAITLRSSSGNPYACVIDCGAAGRGFYFHNNETDSSVVDGFTITNGYLYEAAGGAGICCLSNTSPRIINCRITDNVADNADCGGIYCQQGSPTLINCTIRGNSTTNYGAGVFCSGATMTLVDCTIAENTARIVGGGFFCAYGGNATLINCDIRLNLAKWQGGGIYCHGSDTVLTVIDCTIENNDARGVAGHTPEGGGVYCDGCAASFTRCTIAGNDAVSGSGVRAIEGSLILDDCVIENNTGEGSGGGLCSISADITMTRCIIRGNHTDGGSGGAYLSQGENQLDSCIIIDNTTDGQAGGLTCHGSYNHSVLRGCTIADNWANDAGGGLIVRGNSHTEVINSILWGNWAPTATQLYIGGPSTTLCTVSYCDVEGGLDDVYIEQAASLEWGSGNINDDPLFIDPFLDDYHLTSGSPCIDVGDPNTVPALGETDIDGQKRVWDGDGDDIAVTDMGADEFGSVVTGDLNCDGSLDSLDIDPFVLALSSTPPDYPEYYAEHPDCDVMLSDTNADGSIDSLDIDPFVALLTGS